ncbi:MAG: hypothetical protein CMM07_29250 [Rhodopirellula sp.]|nr:hypothetical protein [Rhodopirellula sp.]
MDADDWTWLHDDDMYEPPCSPIDMDGNDMGSFSQDASVQVFRQHSVNNDDDLSVLPGHQVIGKVKVESKPCAPMDVDDENELKRLVDAALLDHGQVLPNHHDGTTAVPGQQVTSSSSGVSTMSTPHLFSFQVEAALQTSRKDVDMAGSMPTPLRGNPDLMAVDAQAVNVQGHARSTSSCGSESPSSQDGHKYMRKRLRYKQHRVIVTLPVAREEPAPQESDAAAAAAQAPIVNKHRPYKLIQRKLGEYFESNRHLRKVTKKEKWSHVKNQKDRVNIMKSFLRSKVFREQLDETNQAAANEFILMAINNPRVGKPGRRKVPISQKDADKTPADNASSKDASAEKKGEDSDTEESMKEMVGFAFQFTFYCKDDVCSQKYSIEHFSHIQDAAAALVKAERSRLSAQQKRIMKFIKTQVFPEVKENYLENGMQTEICPESWKEKIVRVHTHVQINHKYMQILHAKNKYYFENKIVFVKKTWVDKRSGKTTLNQSQYYATMPKKGAVLVGGNYLPHKHYRVMPQWIEGFYARDYFTHEVAIKEFLNAATNCRVNVANVRFRQEIDNEENEELQRQDVERAIHGVLKPFKWIFTWFNFMNQYFPPPGEMFTRAAFYVLDGVSCAGKSQFIRCMFPVGSLMSIDCSGGKIYPNYRKFQRATVKAIVHEEGTPKMVLQHKAAFQSTNAQIELGNSPVNEGVYYRWFYKIPMIITCNDWHSLVMKEKPDDILWLERNAIVQTCDKRTLY